MDIVEQKLLTELTPILNSKGYNIASINYFKTKGWAKKSKLRIIISNINNDPVTIKDCTTVSKEIAIIIDVYNFITEAYTLEVGSKGCENSLIFFNDFAKNKGKLVELELYLNEGKAFAATIIKAVSGKISFKKIEDTTNNKITITVNDIKSAKLISSQGAIETL